MAPLWASMALAGPMIATSPQSAAARRQGAANLATFAVLILTPVILGFFAREAWCRIVARRRADDHRSMP